MLNARDPIIGHELFYLILILLGLKKFLFFNICINIKIMNLQKKIQLDIAAAFKDMKFDEDLHKYTLEGLSLISTTTFLKKFENGVDFYMIAENKVKSFNRKVRANHLPLDFYRKRWKFLNEESKALGSRVHQFAEMYPHFDEPLDDYERGVIEFFKWFDKNYTLIYQEVRVYNKQYRKAGTVDLLALNKKTGKLAIFDFKTNNKNLFEYYKGNMMTNAFSYLEDCTYHHYCIQLSDYKNMIEFAVPYIIDEMNIVWLKSKLPVRKEYNRIKVVSKLNGKNFRIYRCKDESKTLKEVYKLFNVTDDNRFSSGLNIKLNQSNH